VGARLGEKASGMQIQVGHRPRCKSPMKRRLPPPVPSSNRSRTLSSPLPPPDHLESDTDACSNGSKSKPYFCIAASAASLRAAPSRRAYSATAKHSHSYAPVRHRRCPLTVGNNSACYRTRGHPQDLVTAICCGLRVGKLPSEALRVHPIDSSSYSTALHFFRLSSLLFHPPARLSARCAVVYLC
jgi:hypothetical protein